MGPSFSGLVLVPAQKGVLGPLAKPMGQLVCKTWAPEHCLLDNATPTNKRVVLQELLFGVFFGKYYLVVFGHRYVLSQHPSLSHLDGAHTFMSN